MKAVKKTAFSVYMQESEPETEGSGSKLTRENAELLSKGWKELLPYEKAEYEEKAKNHNEGIQLENLKEVARLNKMLPRELPFVYYGRMARLMKQQQFQEQCQQNRGIVRSMFNTNEWISKSIVVCDFALCFDPNSNTFPGRFIPAEIGLAAFSLKKGIIDNYGRLIDPGNTIPTERRGDAHSTMEQMGLPNLGTCQELKFYETLICKIERFLKAYAEDSQGNYVVFALNRDLEKVTRCLEWVSEVAGQPLRVKVLSLSYWAHLASTENNKEYRQASDLDAGIPLPSQMSQAVNNPIEASMRTVQPSSNRIVGESLTSVFYYPSQYPLTKYGLLPQEDLVDEIVGDSNNYRFYDEVCCMYHMKIREGVQFCALNAVNRYIYSLLEILTVTNKVEIRGGAHFPTIDNLPAERELRLFLLQRWGVTELEWQVKDENLSCRYEEEEDTQQLNADGQFLPMEVDGEIDMKDGQLFENGDTMS